MTFGKTTHNKSDIKILLSQQTAALLEVFKCFMSNLEGGEVKPDKEQVIDETKFSPIPRKQPLTIFLDGTISNTINNDKKWAVILLLALKN
jgi:hypothetical protein